MSAVLGRASGDIVEGGMELAVLELVLVLVLLLLVRHRHRKRRALCGGGQLYTFSVSDGSPSLRYSAHAPFSPPAVARCKMGWIMSRTPSRRFRMSAFSAWTASFSRSTICRSW